MLGRRLTEEFAVVSRHDEALMGAELDEPMRRYLLSREIDELPLDGLAPQPTVFHCKPLKSEHEHLVDAVLQAGSKAAWEIFRNHVVRIDGFEFSPYAKDKAWGQEKVPKLTDAARDEIPRDVVQEVATVIALKGNVSTRSFGLPDSWRGERIRDRHLADLRTATSAPIETKGSKPDAKKARKKQTPPPSIG